MNTQTTRLPERGANQGGFVLITSLIFLAVVTLLAVAAINNSTLQEKIAANTRARETAEQYANAALRAGEAVLSTAAFASYQAAGSTVTLSQSGLPSTVKIWRQSQIPTENGNTVDNPEDFLNENVWDDSAPIQYTPDYNNDPSDDTAVAEYFIEELGGCYQTNLNPDACASGSGVVIYRITARAIQGSAAVVTQSTFAKYY